MWRKSVIAGMLEQHDVINMYFISALWQVVYKLSVSFIVIRLNILNRCVFIYLSSYSCKTFWKREENGSCKNGTTGNMFRERITLGKKDRQEEKGSI